MAGLREWWTRYLAWRTTGANHAPTQERLVSKVDASPSDIAAQVTSNMNHPGS